MIRFLGHLSQINLEMLLDEPSPEIIHADCHYVIESTSREQFRDANLREFSLVIDEGPTLLRLLRERRALLSNANIDDGVPRGQIRTTASREMDLLDDTGIVPVFTIHKRTDAQAVNTFINRVNLDGVAEPLVALNLTVPELQNKIL